MKKTKTKAKAKNKNKNNKFVHHRWQKEGLKAKNFIPQCAACRREERIVCYPPATTGCGQASSSFGIFR